ncbi:ABC transporter ATP-binding protein [Rhodohalobacter sulfatireducens]|uniref:ABC transporter ATP-binding protein n=1 Tax=Rhodohalobacter sulfatireducens TaxID=2911366 RepID=A0ABS9K864_9BACT|nr:ABC transporter ATP-binding protein [Rhodohalobacter sulfatireducens]MCG2587036.1 ABC transporter ATP-binding protein [Rhodohalobacter sulfatireducens]
MERALVIQNLTKAYDKEPVLKELNLEVPTGNIFGLIGPNGAGKSTLIGILTGLLSYDQGFVEIDGMPYSAENEVEIKKRVASVLQPPLLFENFTSYEFISYVCDMYKVSNHDLDERISSLMEYFEIEEFAQVKTKQLSSGSRKKLAFCAAILTDPKLLFLDEPFESVDVISIGRMKNVIRRLKGKGTTIFITSHILEVVENLCDDIAILHKGKILAYLDSESRRELEKDSNLSEIFEQYIESGVDNEDRLSWL